MVEIWKNIKGYEGMYQVSNHGRVRSFDRVEEINSRWGKPITRTRKGRLLSQGITRGYFCVGLYKNNNGKNYRVNRLVAEAFIPNPNNLPIVGHNDDDKFNNHVNNLYWTDYVENSLHNGINKRKSRKLRKPIVGIKGDKMITFDSATEAAENGFNESAIRNVLCGIAKTHNGYVWEFTNNQLT